MAYPVETSLSSEVVEAIHTVLGYLHAERQTTAFDQEPDTFRAADVMGRWFNSALGID